MSSTPPSLDVTYLLHYRVSRAFLIPFRNSGIANPNTTCLTVALSLPLLLPIIQRSITRKARGGAHPTAGLLPRVITLLFLFFVFLPPDAVKIKKPNSTQREKKATGNHHSKVENQIREREQYIKRDQRKS
ncbi:hypothetical protein VNO77_16040 [Canavalia gladiata]|uniref:Uncharacterized protein n=1 Tax=Canavalia gladiata TaxID=3824 RepID=A0AAN9M0A0_CANGL